MRKILWYIIAEIKRTNYVMMQLMLSNLSNVFPIYPLSTYLIIYSMQNWIYETQYFAKEERKTDIVNVCLQKTISNSGRFLWEYLRNQKYLKLTSCSYKHGTKTKKRASCHCFRCIVFSNLYIPLLRGWSKADAYTKVCYYQLSKDYMIYQW